MSVYRYAFDSTVPFASVKSSLAFALMAVESLVGEPEVVLGVEHALDETNRTVAIGGDTRVGTLLNKLFCGFVIREFGAEAFEVKRVKSSGGMA